MHPEEYLDLVNENDEVIGRKLRSEIYAKDIRNFRVINVFLVNARGQIWIPRRTADKAVAPLGLDMSAAGHVESGETYDDTFVREVREELTIDVTKVPYRTLGRLTPKNGVHCFESIYEIHSDETPAYNHNDFVEYFRLTPQEVINRIEGGDKAKSDVLPLIKAFYL